MSVFIRDTLKPALVLFGALSVLTGMAYPLLVTGIAQALFPRQAEGSLVVRAEIPVGSRLVGQAFHHPAYFWGRPSATSPPYNAAASSGSNLGPSSPALRKQVEQRAAGLRAADPAHRTGIPPDLLTASGSGLDPHILPESALYQVSRVARERGLLEGPVRRLVEAQLEGRQFGLLGERRVNVLELNLALDRLAGHAPVAHFRTGDGTMIQRCPGTDQTAAPAGNP